MRWLAFSICVLLLPGCGDENGGAEPLGLTIFELRPALPVEREGYTPMQDLASGSRFAYYVADTPVVTLSDFASAEVQLREGRSRHIVRATLSKDAASKLVKDFRARQRWAYAIIVNDRLRGILQIGRGFNGTVELRVGRKLAEGIVRAVRRE